MQGQKIETTPENKPVFLLRLDREDITALMEDQTVACTVLGSLDGKSIALEMHGARNALITPWFEAQVYGKTPFYMFVPSKSEEELLKHLKSRDFEIRTSYRGTMSSAYAKFEIESA